MTQAQSAARPGMESLRAPDLFGRGMLYVVGLSLQFAVAALISPILAHLLPAAEFGALATMITLHQVMLVLGIIGLDQAVLLQRSEDQDSGAARGLIAVSLAIAFFATSVFLLTAPAWRTMLGLGDYAAPLNVVILLTAPAATVQVMLSLLLSEDRIRHFFLVSVISTVGGQLVGLVLLFTANRDVLTYLLGGIGSQFAAMALAIVFTKPKASGLVNRPVAKRALKLGLPLTAAGVALFQLSSGDRLVIQVILGPEEVGRYQVAYVLGSLVILLLSFTSSAWMPLFAAMHDHPTRWAVATRSRDALYRILLPVTAGMTLATPFVLQLVLPASFRPEELSVVVFLVLIAAFPVASACATGRLLVILRMGKTVGLLTGAAAVASLILTIALVPIWGIVGSAAATLMTYTLLAGLQRWALPAAPVWQKVPTRLASAVLGVVLACAVSVLLPQTLDWNLTRMAVGLGCIPWLITACRRARASVQESLAS